MPAVGYEDNSYNYALIEKSNNKKWQVIDQYNPNLENDMYGYLSVFKLPGSNPLIMSFKGLLRLNNSFSFQYDVIKKGEDFEIYPYKIRGNAENDLYIADYNNGAFCILMENGGSINISTHMEWGIFQ